MRAQIEPHVSDHADGSVVVSPTTYVDLVAGTSYTFVIEGMGTGAAAGTNAAGQGTPVRMIAEQLE